MKKISLLFIAWIIPLTLFADIETSYLEIDGVGATKAEAVRNGLIEVIKQTNGVKIDSKREYYKAISEAGVSVEGESSHAIAISEETQKVITEATKGFIRNYSIVDAQQEADQWHVRLGIKIKNYKAPGHNPDKRRKIAIIPFEYKESYNILNKYEVGRAVSKRFTQSLVSKITQARKFTVLDRENSKYYQQEKNFLLSGNSNQDELLKLGKRLGTDYLLIGQILDLSIENITTTSNIGLPATSQLVCNATISYRIMMMATQQVKWSETISKEFVIEENSNQNSAEAIVANTTDKISNFIMANILNNIYPPKIITVTQSSVIINQGGNSIESGEVFKAYKEGQRLVDPYTNEFLGYEEIETGTIEITNVNPKVSYAKVIDGKVVKGMILRKIQSNQNQTFESEGKAITDVTTTPSGGVVLPFD